MVQTVLQLLFPAGTEEYIQQYVFLNIYFVENKDRYLIVSSHKLNDLSPSRSISHCIDLTDGFFSTTDSVLCLFCLFVFTEAFMFGSRKLSNTLDSQSKDARVVDEGVCGGVQLLEGDSRVPHTDS